MNLGDKPSSDMTYREWLTGTIAAAMVSCGDRHVDTIATMSTRIASLVIRKLDEFKTKKAPPDPETVLKEISESGF